MTNEQRSISTAAIQDVQRLERSLKAMNIWYVVALYLLMVLASGAIIWTVYTRDVSAPYMYVIACITMIVGVTFRYFAITKIGRFLMGLFAFAYSLFWLWVIFFNGVVVGKDPGQRVFPMEFYLGGALFALATIMFVVQPIFQLRRKRLINQVTRHIKTEASEDETTGVAGKADTEQDKEGRADEATKGGDSDG